MADKERLIDNDKLIKKINAEIDAWAKSRMCMTADELLETIEEFEEAAEPDNGWISVKDRLPDGDGNFYEGGLEESKYVLVYGCYEDNYGYGIGTYIRDHIDHDAGWSGCLSGVYELDCCNVTHWQHLPEPPKGE